MEHNTCRENLSAYLDGELPAGEKPALESHLASCAACASELAELKRVQVIFKKHAMQPVPDALKEGVFAKKPAAPFFSGWLKPVLAFSAAAAGLMMIFGWHEFRGRDQLYSPALSSITLNSSPSRDGESASDLAEIPSAVRGGKFDGAAQGSAARPAGKGAYGQAKFAGRGSAAGIAAAYPAGASLAKAAPRQDWLKKIISQCQAGQPGNPPYSVWRYVYNGGIVYYLPPQCCDQYSRLYDEAGKLLCAPDGGMTGQGDGKCADFYKLRTGGELIWQDPRGK